MLGDAKGFQSQSGDGDKERGRGSSWRFWQADSSSVVPPFNQPKSDDLALKRRVFVPPENFPEVISDTQQRIYFVYADRLEGTKTDALMLADLLCKKDSALKAQADSPPIYIYRHMTTEKLLRLSDIISAKELKDCVCIIPGAFDQGLQRSELSRELLDRYQEYLRGNDVNAYLVITVDERLPVHIRDPIQGTAGISLKKVFDNHVEYYFGAEGAFGEDNEARRKPLDAVYDKYQEILIPPQIGELFEKFSREIGNRGQITLKEFERLLDENVRRYVIDVSQRQRAWFNNLRTFNERIFGLLVALMQDLDLVSARSQYVVEELYYLLVNQLRQDPGLSGDRTFRDPRRIGSDEMIRSLGLSETRLAGTTYLAFSNRMIRESILEQADNYHHLLWVFADVLINMLTGETPVPLDSAPEILANLLGRIGLRRQPRLWNLISRITEANTLDDAELFLGNQDGSMGKAFANLAALMLEPASRQPDHYDFLTQVLQLWLPKKSRRDQGIFISPQYYRAAAYTIRLVYPVLKDKVFNATEDESEEKRQAESALKAINAHLLALAENCGQFNAYLTQLRVNQERNDFEQLEDFIREHPLENQKQLELFRRELRKELSQRIEDKLVLYMLNAVEDSLNALLETLTSIARFYPGDVVELLSEWIQDGLNTVQTDYEEQKIEAAVESILEDWERVGRGLPSERGNEAMSQQLLNSEAIWYVALAAANKLFWATDFEPPKEEKEDEAESQESRLKDKKGSSKKSEDNEKKSGDQQDSKLAPEEESRGFVASGTDEQQSDTNQSAELQLAVPPLTNDPNDGSRDDLPSLDDILKPEENAPSQEQREVQAPQEALKTWLDIERTLDPLLTLLPVLLKSSVYEHSAAGFLKHLPRGEKIVTALEKGHVRNGESRQIAFDPHLDMLLSTPPIEIALFRIRRWYEMVQTGRVSDTALRQWRNLVYPRLLQLFNSASQAERDLLRDALFRQGWVNSQHAELRRIARSLLARSFVLDGVVMDLPLDRYGVLVLDATRRPWGMLPAFYYQRAFRLLQRLSVVTPVQVYYLGTDDKMLRVGSEREVTDSIAHLRDDDLRPRRFRSRLLMHLFENIRSDATFRPPIAENSHFMLVLTPVRQIEATEAVSADILDLLDVLETALPQLKTAQTADDQWDPFADPSLQAAQAPQNELPILTWEWAGKFFIGSGSVNDLYTQIRQSLGSKVSTETLDRLVTIVDVNDEYFLHDDIRRLEYMVRQNIARYLYGRSGDELRADLEVYRVLPDFTSSDFIPLIQRLREWVYTLDDIAEAQHPRDISLSIVWSVLMLTRYDNEYNLTTAVSLVREWLMSTDALPRQMGLALTRMLFNFLSACGDLASEREIHQTLSLLEPLLGLDPEYSEFSSILFQVLGNAHDRRWAEPLLSDNPTFAALLTHFGMLSRRADVRRILNDISLFENVWGLLTVYLQLEWRLDEFMLLLGDVYRWVEENPVAKRAAEREVFRSKLDAHGNELSMLQLSEVERVCASPVFKQYIEDTLRWLVQITQGIHKDNMHVYTSAAERVKAVIDVIRLRALSGTAGLLQDFARLSSGRYGVVLVDIAQSSILSETALQFIHQFRHDATDKDIGKVVISVHLVGRAETAFTGLTGEPRPRDLLSRDGSRHPALIGPVLELYPPEQIGFILLLTDREPLDLTDWTENPTWAARFLLQTTRATLRPDINRRQTRSNNKRSIFELTDEILHMLKEH